jgi:hypothetical protein
MHLGCHECIPGGDRREINSRLVHYVGEGGGPSFVVPGRQAARGCSRLRPFV